jgi:hypothetical protein
LRKGIGLATVPKVLGPDRPLATAIDRNVTDTPIQEGVEREWWGRE